MRLSILLFALYLKLKRAAKKNPAVQRMLKKRDYTLVIRTSNERHARYFTFDGGEVFSRRGLHPKPDVELVWCDAATAFRALLAGDDATVMQAMGKSQLKIEGNLDHFFWFGEVTKLI